MILAEGTKVELKFTGDRGVVTDLLEHDMVMVLLDDGDEIPVATGDLIRPDESLQQVAAPAKDQCLDVPRFDRRS